MKQSYVTDRVAGILLIALAAVYAYLATQLEVGFLSDPIGPKAMPYLLAALLTIVSVYIIIRPEADPEWPSSAAFIRIGMALLIFILYANFIIPLGFIVSTSLAVWLLSLVFRGPILWSFVSAIIFSLAMYGLFAVLLDLSLPTGRLWQNLLGG